MPCSCLTTRAARQHSLAPLTALHSQIDANCVKFLCQVFYKDFFPMSQYMNSTVSDYHLDSGVLVSPRLRFGDIKNV